MVGDDWKYHPGRVTVNREDVHQVGLARTVHESRSPFVHWGLHGHCSTSSHFAGAATFNAYEEVSMPARGWNRISTTTVLFPSDGLPQKVAQIPNTFYSISY